MGSGIRSGKRKLRKALQFHPVQENRILLLELFPPPRVTHEVERGGRLASHAIDLSTGWGLRQASQRATLWE
eukprot:4408972-Pyramimonas_sp.AAC.1